MFDMDEIFVFGSNLAGRHGKGAALDALKFHGAVYGVGYGRTGNSYAIPTKGHYLEVLSLAAIQLHVSAFIIYAITHPHSTFRVTAIGTGLAGYTPAQIGPMFAGAPANCRLPPEFQPYR